MAVSFYCMKMAYLHVANYRNCEKLLKTGQYHQIYPHDGKDLENDDDYLCDLNSIVVAEEFFIFVQKLVFFIFYFMRQVFLMNCLIYQFIDSFDDAYVPL